MRAEAELHLIVRREFWADFARSCMLMLQAGQETWAGAHNAGSESAVSACKVKNHQAAVPEEWKVWNVFVTEKRHLRGRASGRSSSLQGKVLSCGVCSESAALQFDLLAVPSALRGVRSSCHPPEAPLREAIVASQPLWYLCVLPTWYPGSCPHQNQPVACKSLPMGSRSTQQHRQSRNAAKGDGGLPAGRPPD